MFNSFDKLRRGAASSLRALAVTYLTALAALAVLSVILAAFKVWPWLQIDLPGWPFALLPGQALQVTLMLVALALLIYLPSALKVMQLEQAHRKFSIKMEDVARAYQLSHSADRRGVFKLSSEFDAVRERISFMRQHPDLASLEPDVIEVAAQMSQIGRELAEVYSDDKVARARAVLKQRQTEVADLQERLEQAKSLTDELRRWTTQISVEQSVADAQIDQLCKDLAELLPELNDDVELLPAEAAVLDEGSKVVSIPSKKISHSPSGD